MVRLLAAILAGVALAAIGHVLAGACQTIAPGVKLNSLAGSARSVYKNSATPESARTRASLPQKGATP